MNVGVIVFPGSNCDHDCQHVFQHVLGQSVQMIWHKETSLKGVDAVILPAIPFPVPTIAETDVEASGGPATLAMVARFTGLTRPFNTLGLPALSLPCGFDGNGVPMGLQVIGRPFAEGLLYRIGHAYQGATDHHRRVPA